MLIDHEPQILPSREGQPSNRPATCLDDDDPAPRGQGRRRSTDGAPFSFRTVIVIKLIKKQE